MSARASEDLHMIEADAQAELAMARASRPEETLEEPQSEWLFDASDVQRGETGLRSLLGAVEAMREDGPSEPLVFETGR